MKKLLPLLALLLVLTGCVNVHVHFPPAPAEPAAGADAKPASSPTAPATPAASAPVQGKTP